MKKILEHIEGISRNEFLPIVGPVKGQALVRLVKERKPRKILEIGALVGYSTILMASSMPKNSKIITIEKSPGMARIARKNIAKAKLSSKVKVIEGDACKVIPKLRHKFDFVFIDAEKSEYVDYIQLAEMKMSKRCTVVADNVKIFSHTLSDYLHYVRSKYKSKTHDFGFDAIEVSEKLN